MNYEKNYFDYINFVKKQNRTKNKHDTHHIIPRCIGGNDNEINLVLLTPREHFLAHYLLTKIFPNEISIKFAFQAMSMWKRKYFNSKLYEKIRNELTESVSKPVINLTDLKTYNSITQAHLNTKISIMQISRVCNKKQRTAGGHFWEFYDKDKNYNIIIPTEIFKYKNKKVICIETKKIYKNMQEVCRLENINMETLRYHLTGKTKRCKKLHWEFYDKDKNYDNYNITWSYNYNPICAEKSRKKIICVETGEIFNSISEAAKKNNCSNATISYCLNKKQKTAVNYHWEYFKQ